ncbi:MAG TPA: DNA-binding response regulator [Comamonadaceae bacterium]|uniref:LytR/AlgR family response regulator transcription factor n=1 Tax=Pulveribacter sp. TaxID=2678893 RepID=UPI000EC7F67E|nr:LytTR family DNA-binding domain-containing protein [Pulveribacter sp.]HCL85975.1 DNA-binding response regulator [Comamonadaceae bacterium]
MHILIVDDEPLARSRLRRLLADCGPHYRVGEAQHAADALAKLQGPGASAVDVVLLDIHMPGMDGMALAHQLRALPEPPAIVFVTAHSGHALSAFELDAVDYLTKPVRLERLQQALAKARRAAPTAAVSPPPAAAPVAAEALVIHERGHTERVPMAEVLYLRAELKYVTVRTPSRSYVIDDPLTELESRHAAHFLRVHRNTLVARHAMRALVRHDAGDGEGEGWAVRLHGLAQPLPVSRRQVAAVREALSEG